MERQELVDFSCLFALFLFLFCVVIVAGKSTLVNMIANYFMCGSLDDPPGSMHVVVPATHLSATLALPHSERARGDSTRSKTTRAQLYVWDDFIFIDTPGFADTDGPEQDDLNVLNILDAAAMAGSLTAIIVVVNGSVSRAAVNVKTAMSRLRGNIPDVALDNIICVMTNCACSKLSNFPLSILPFEPCAVCYLNNSAFSSHPSTWRGRTKDIIAVEWLCSIQVIEKMARHIRSMRTFSTEQFRRMHSNRSKIIGKLKESLVHVDEMSKLHTKFLDISANLTRHKATMERNRSYESQRTVYKEVTDRVQERESCRHCSGSGRVTEYETAEVLVGMQCVPVMTYAGIGLMQVPITRTVRQANSQSCGSCSGMGSRLVYNNKTRTVSEVVQDINAEMKKLFSEASRDVEKYDQLKADVDAARTVLENKITEVAAAVNTACDEILPICSNFSLKDECAALLQQVTTASALETVPQSKVVIKRLVSSLKTIADRATASGHRRTRDPRQPSVIIEYDD